MESLLLGIAAINAGKKIYFYTVHDLINHLVKSKEEQQLEKAMNKSLKSDMLILDEKLTIAIVDRLIHHSHLLFFNRDSYRKEHALIK